MTSRASRGLAVAGLLFMLSCVSDKNIMLVDHNFGDEIELQQNLAFTFNHNLAAEPMLDRWDTTAYISFDPPVEGRFKWIEPNKLLFSPTRSFAPSTKYSATLTESLLAFTEGMQLGEERSLQFHTHFLRLEAARTRWMIRQGSAVPGLELSVFFNQPVLPQDLAGQLELELDGASQRFSVLGQEPGSSLRCELPELKAEDVEGKMLTIRVRAGLPVVGSAWQTEEAQELSTAIPMRDFFAITHAEPIVEGGETIVRVFTNQEVASEDIKSLVKIRPKISFRVTKFGSGFEIAAPFAIGTGYSIRVKPELSGIFGTSLAKQYIQNITFGEVAPSLAFTNSKSLYLTTKGARNVGLQIFNVPKVTVRVAKIYENNIMEYLRNGQENNYYYDEVNSQSHWVQGYAEKSQYGNLVFKQEYETRLLQRKGGQTLLNLDFDDRIPFEGIYVLSVESTDKKWVRASRLLVISDLGIICKSTPNDVLVFVNSIKTTDAVAGAKVQFISSNNQVLHTGKTDSRGIASFNDIKSKWPDFSIAMVSVEKGSDYNYLIYRQTRVQTSRFDVGGRSESPAGYQAFVYGDRNIYRPGEKIVMNTILRDREWQPVADIPIKVRLLLPNGKEYSKIKLQTNRQGAAESSFKLPAGIVTGTYTAEVYTANDILLRSRSISVEEFMPDRIKVDLALSSSSIILPSTIEVTAGALNLFGPPAADRNYEMEFTMQRRAFRARDYPRYNFHISSKNDVSFNKILRTGKTDSEGKFRESIAVSSNPYGNMGVLDGRVYATVFDETGRPVHRVQQLTIYTQKLLYGIRDMDRYVSTRQPLKLHFIAVDTAGKAVKGAKANVQVVKIFWESVLQRSGGRFRYVSERREQVVLNKKLQLDDKGGSIEYLPTRSGRYEVRIFGEDPGSYVSRRFYAYGWGDTDNYSFEVDTEGQVTIELDKEQYEVGDKARVLFKTPFAGKLLVTVERDRVFENFVLQTDKKSASLTLALDERYRPNVYIAATLIKEHIESEIPLTVAHGYQPLLVNKASSRLALEIDAPSKVRSKSTQEIIVRSRPESDIEVTIAVVDEGILQLKDFKTPDPHKYFYAKRALEVKSFDVYPFLFPELQLQQSSVGGDGYDLAKRVNPLSNKRVKLVSFWSGILKTDRKGEAEYSIDIPQFSGDLRIMAVAYKNDDFGSAQHNMKVADPIVVSTALPRFLSPGDTVLVPVTLSNTTAKEARAAVGLRVTGPLRVFSEDLQQVSIAANRESRVEFTAYALAKVGQGSCTVNVEAFGESFSEQIDLTIRPATSLIKQTDVGMLKDGESAALDVAAVALDVPLDARLVVSRSPLARFTKDLSYLLGYPHGCVEQTVSKAFPQIYFNELSQAINQNGTQESNPHFNVQEAIRKLSTMQLYNGALSYWPGGESASWWGSAYAAHFMLEARKAGFEVNERIFTRLLAYLKNRLKERQTRKHFYRVDDRSYEWRWVPHREIFYALYILALHGEPDMVTMNFYKAKTDSLTLDSRYMLAASFALAGDRDSYRQTLPHNFAGEQSKTMFGGSFASQVRDEAIALNVLIEVDPDNPQIASIARNIGTYLQARRYLNTQERSFAILALGKMAAQNMDASISASISIDGKKRPDFSGRPVTFGKEILGTNVTIEAKGEGRLYYFWEVQGYNNEARFPEEDNYLRVRKQFYSRDGRRLQSSDFRQNDLIVVQLSIQGTSGTDVDNVVITDLLPAGLEIENPRISSLPGMDWIDDKSAPDYFDIRDDRINLFTDVRGNNIKHFYYMVRAVSPGTFVMGPVSADAMYNGEYHSYHGAGTVRVLQ